MSRGSILWLSFQLALKDLSHDRKVAGTLVVTVGSVLAPLLLLLGLKTGVIQTAKQELLSDPRNLEVVIYQNSRLNSAWFEEMDALLETRFVIPKTRTINATIDVVNKEKRIFQSVEMVPTAEQDPLLHHKIEIPTGVESVLISAPLAEALDLHAGDEIYGVLKRRLDRAIEHTEIPMRVLGVLPERMFGREAIFTSLELLIATEEYRDGYRVPVIGVDQGKQRDGQRQEFANARIYASGLDEVLTLAAKLRAKGLEIRTRAADIETVKSMDQLLTFIFLVVAVIAGIGGAGALGSSVWINVDRKRNNLALLRLMGFFDIGVMLVPIFETLIISILGFSLAYALYLTGAQVFNFELRSSLPEYGYACRLHGVDLAATFGLVVALSVIVSSIAGVRASRLDPAECLRDSV